MDSLVCYVTLEPLTIGFVASTMVPHAYPMVFALGLCILSMSFTLIIA